MSRYTDSPMTLVKLVQRSGVPPRTIRLYITRGLLDGPRRRGRGATYGPEHLGRLKKIRELQEQGRTLHEIAQLLVNREETSALPVGDTWTRYQPSPDVLVWVRSGASAWRNRHIRDMVARMAAELATLEKETQHGL